MDEFDEWVAAAGPQLARTAYLLVGDRRLAEDLVQHSLLATWTHFRKIENPNAYAREIMVRTASSWWRRKWRGEVPHDPMPEMILRGIEESSDRRMSLAIALRDLSPKQRAVIVLRFYEDMSEAEIASTLRFPIGTVRSTTSRALAALRRSKAINDVSPKEVG